jgi:hypothetical protein
LALKVTQLEAKNVQLEVKIGKLEAKVEQQDSLFKNYFSREKNERTAAPDSIPISNNASAVAFPGIPSSCADLKMIGHIWSGIFSVMGLAKMESVYCDFTKLPDDAGKLSNFRELFSCNYLIYNSFINKKVLRNGLDMSTSNRRPSISTSREILILTQKTLRFRSILRGSTRETPWI